MEDIRVAFQEAVERFKGLDLDLHVIECSEHSFVLCFEPGETSSCLFDCVAALRVKCSSEVVEEHIFFRVWRDGWCREVGR